jgi:hypothetical protein
VQELKVAYTMRKFPNSQVARIKYKSRLLLIKCTKAGDCTDKAIGREKRKRGSRPKGWYARGGGGETKKVCNKGGK